jgi:hypothetical protein
MRTRASTSVSPDCWQISLPVHDGRSEDRGKTARKMATWQMRGLFVSAIRSRAGSWPLTIIFHVVFHLTATSLGPRARTPYYAERAGEPARSGLFGARSFAASTARPSGPGIPERRDQRG